MWLGILVCNKAIVVGREFFFGIFVRLIGVISRLLKYSPTCRKSTSKGVPHLLSS